MILKNKKLLLSKNDHSKGPKNHPMWESNPGHYLIFYFYESKCSGFDPHFGRYLVPMSDGFLTLLNCFYFLKSYIMANL